MGAPPAGGEKLRFSPAPLIGLRDFIP